MQTEIVTISPKFQIVLPRTMREMLGLEAGRKMVAIEKGGQITLVPVVNIKEMKGAFRGISMEGLREDEDRI